MTERPLRTGLDVINMADVQSRAIQWLWPGYIARGRLTLIVGDPGVGKSWFTLALAAHHGQGWLLPGQIGEPSLGAILLVGAEDPLEDTVKPRLMALGAFERYPNQITALRATKTVSAEGVEQDSPFSLAEDMALLAQLVADRQYTLIIIDPINAYLGGEVDAHRDTDIRSILAPLAALAERSGAAVVAVMHLNKMIGGKAIYRVLGSIGYAAAARSVLLVGQESEADDNTTLRHIVQIKNTLGIRQPAQSFDLAEGQLRWVGESTATQESLLGYTDSEVRMSLRDLEDTVQAALELDGGFSGEQLRAWSREVGLSERAGQKLAKRLRLNVTRSGLGRGQTRWSRPPEDKP